VAAILFNAIGCSKMKLFVDVAVEVSFLLTNLRWSSETFTMWLNMINIEGNVVYNRRISITCLPDPNFRQTLNITSE